MFEIAEMLPPSEADSALWPLMKQAGITQAVGAFTRSPKALAGEKPWANKPLTQLKQKYEDFGFNLTVIEDRPPLNLTKRGLPGRDAEIDDVKIMIENMGRVGIPVWCYEWMADFNWLRTNTAVPSRGGSLVTAFNSEEAQRTIPDSNQGSLDDETLWASLKYFLDEVIPIAEKWGVTLSMHPDDPPIPKVRGISRIMSSVQGFDRLLTLNDSPMNSITFCQGNFRLMTDDLPALIRKYGEQSKITFVHLRDVRGTNTNFEETWHDDGPTDMLACFKAYRDINFNGVMRPDHVPTLYGENPGVAGYGLLGRLFAVGYLRGLQHAVQQ